MSSSSSSPSPLPPRFKAFLRENGIDAAVYSQRLPRYLRANPRRPGPPLTAAEVREALDPDSAGGVEVREEEGVRGFFRVEPGDTPVARCQLYREGGVYGIDLASGLAVEALGVRPGMAVLDLCCAPGAKLCMIADRLWDAREGRVRGSVTGVDVSAERMASARSLVRRYSVMRARMFRADGRTFSLPPLGEDEELRHCRVVEAGDGRAGGGGGGGGGEGTYDRVLVDAECTHDGSVRHVTKYERIGWERFERGFLDPVRLAGLRDLQRALLLNGFRLLRPGGELVYSTCSFARAQNEDVVAWLLGQRSDAALLPVEQCGTPFSPGLGMPLAARFDPVVSGTSGLFVARVVKKEEEEEEEAVEKG